MGWAVWGLFREKSKVPRSFLTQDWKFEIPIIPPADGDAVRESSGLTIELGTGVTTDLTPRGIVFALVRTVGGIRLARES
jgi:hypothetical protein